MSGSLSEKGGGIRDQGSGTNALGFLRHRKTPTSLGGLVLTS